MSVAVIILVAAMFFVLEGMVAVERYLSEEQFSCLVNLGIGLVAATVFCLRCHKSLSP